MGLNSTRSTLTICGKKRIEKIHIFGDDCETHPSKTGSVFSSVTSSTTPLTCMSIGTYACVPLVKKRTGFFVDYRYWFIFFVSLSDSKVTWKIRLQPPTDPFERSSKKFRVCPTTLSQAAPPLHHALINGRLYPFACSLICISFPVTKEPGRNVSRRSESDPCCHRRRRHSDCSRTGNYRVGPLELGSFADNKLP